MSSNMTLYCKFSVAEIVLVATYKNKYHNYYSL